VRRLALSAIDLLYAALSALMLSLGFYMELRRERTERARTDPSTDARLARIEAQDPVREAMERLAKCESQLETLNDRLAEFQAAVDAVAAQLVEGKAHATSTTVLMVE
jgi:hypothetical protein